MFADTQNNNDLPKIEFFDHDFKQFLASDDQAGLDLKKVADAARKNERVFESLSEPLLMGKLNLDEGWINANTIGLIVIFVINMIWAVFFYRLYRSHQAVILQLAAFAGRVNEVGATLLETNITSDAARSTENSSDTPPVMDNGFDSSVLAYVFVIIAALIIGMLLRHFLGSHRNEQKYICMFIPLPSRERY